MTGRTFTSTDPATGKIVWEGEESTTQEVDEAVQRARETFEWWAERPLKRRLNFLSDWEEILNSKRLQVADAISSDTGKTHWESDSEVGAMIAKIQLSIDAFHARTGESSKEMPLGRSVIRHKPHGVVAVFGPFNFPGHLPNGHIVPALLAGNTVVFKPSELTPMVGELFIQLWNEIGLPEGVLNLVQGGADIGRHLSSHPGIDGLFFTGSSRTGCALSEAFGKTPEKILALEMGGNNPLIVDEVTDLQGSAYTTIQSAFITSGQRCTCARRLIVPEGDRGDRFIDELYRMSKAIVVGNPADYPEPFYGPQISKEAATRIYERYLELVQRGGREILRMTRKSDALLTPGIVDVSKIEVEDEEVFGPLLQLYRVKDFEEAIEVANNTRYGLSAGLLSDNREKWERFLFKSRAGIVNWNNQTTGASGAAPFGGIGLSGNHRPSAYYAADYCSYPVASVEKESSKIPDKLSPGIDLLEV